MPMRLNFARSLDFTGAIVAGGNPRIFLDGGPTYDELTLATNLAADEFTLIIEVDGDTRVKLTGQQLLDREAYDGRTVTSGYFVFSFVDNISRMLQGEALTGLTTQPGQRITVSLEIAADAETVSPTAVLYAETSPNRPTEYVLRVIPEQIPVTSTGENTFNGFRRAARPAFEVVPVVGIRRIFNYGPVSALAVDQDGRQIYGKRNLPKAVNDARLKRNGKTVPTSSTCFVFDPIVKGNVIQDLLDTYSNEYLRFTYTTTSDADITAITEYVENVRPMPRAA